MFSDPDPPCSPPGSTEPEEPIEVPFTSLSPEALRGLVEEFITREGTDYGHIEMTIDDKVEDVMRQLRRGEAKIVFDLKSKTVNILPSR
jgi:uncharacterized protein YheU (UPF0270 family)